MPSFYYSPQNSIRTQSRLFHTEEIKVLYMFPLMKGAAFEWASRMHDTDAPLLKDFALATQALLSIFEEPDRL